MHRVHYAGDSLVTGSEIAHALLDYAQALAQADASATIDIPTVEDDGSQSRTEVLIGPASQLSSHEERSDHAEPIDDVLVGKMRAESERLRQFGSALPSAGLASPESTGNWDELEEF